MISIFESFCSSVQPETVNCRNYSPNAPPQSTAVTRHPGLRVYRPHVDNEPVPLSPWELRIERASTLSQKHSFAAEILSFYRQIAGFQHDLYLGWEKSSLAHPADLPPGAAIQFAGFLAALEKHAPPALAEKSQQLRRLDLASLSTRLDNSWLRGERSPSQPEEFLARAFLQPRAVLVRMRSGAQWNGYAHSVCPFCGRKPGPGILRPRGDGGQRSLLCSFCLAEWEFRRIVCAGCGEESERKLPVYTAQDFDYIRVECCDTCKQYLKTIDLTRNGLADPVVDEIASAPLDLWAHQQGYTKIEPNLLGM